MAGPPIPPLTNPNTEIREEAEARKKVAGRAGSRQAHVRAGGSSRQKKEGRKKAWKGQGRNAGRGRMQVAGRTDPFPRPKSPQILSPRNPQKPNPHKEVHMHVHTCMAFKEKVEWTRNRLEGERGRGDGLSQMSFEWKVLPIEPGRGVAAYA